MTKRSNKPAAQLPETAVADAEAALAALTEARAALVGKVTDYQQAVERLAYHAHALHDPESSKELGDKRSELIDLEHRLREYDSAIVQAERVLTEAQQVEARAAECTRAELLRQRLRVFVSLCERRGELLGLLVKNAGELREAQLGLAMYGSGHPSLDLIFTYGALADRTQLAAMPWGRALTETLMSNEKRDWRRLAAEWAANLRPTRLRR